ncbi:glycosyltransferase [Chrysiogenes arsenatis]|uniref:glycosyltransferase n=1 Tax=Chrysiogenes arsenatis TaxID=309797 RepID=UPI00041C6973|nr:glycosyltransferase [Chrysiogenes arsenatis]
MPSQQQSITSNCVEHSETRFESNETPFDSPKLSILTATYNAAHFLPELVASLRQQTDKRFEWIIADGASTDGTVEILENFSDLHITLSSCPDFGIYDALNRAIGLSTTEYYVVLGADDTLYPDAVANYINAIECSNADIISAQIAMPSGQISAGRRKWPWLYSQFAYVSCHSVGVAIRKSLHNEFGLYNRKLPIAADQLFLKSAGDGRVYIFYANFVAGIYSNCGLSSVDVIGSLCEFYRVQLMTGENKFIQTVIFISRLLKHLRRL